jgi:hypothetical protein
MTAPISNCIVVEQRAVIQFCGQKALKIPEAGDMEQAQRLTVQWGSFAPR